MTPQLSEPSGSYYYLEPQPTDGSNPPFQIVYGTDSSVVIGLTQEPLGQVRLEAEQALQTELNIAAKNRDRSATDCLAGTRSQESDHFRYLGRLDPLRIIRSRHRRPIFRHIHCSGHNNVRGDPMLSSPCAIDQARTRRTCSIYPEWTDMAVIRRCRTRATRNPRSRASAARH